MKPKGQTISDLMKGCVQYFEQQSFSQPRIDRYKSMWQTGIVRFMAERSIQYYDASVGEEYINIHIAGSIVTPCQRDFIRSVYVLSEFQEKGTVNKRRYHPVERKLSGKIGILMEQFLLHLESLRRSRTTINDHRSYLYRFLTFIEGKHLLTVEEIKEEHLLSFVSTMTNNNICVVSSIRLFFGHLFDIGVLPYNPSEVLRHYRWDKKEKLPSVYTATEVLKIESSIKRGDATGKRDYAMMLLATRLGLRASDIAHLSFENISWESSTIILSQFKTGKRIELPLLAQVGEAIIDYLKYGRKRSESTRVFLYTRAPFTSMENAAVAGTLGRIIASSGVDTTGRKHGPHAMRHSLASRFLENKEPIPIISEALGHQSTETTGSYLRIDIESLIQCALDVPVVPEEFYEQKGGAFYERY
jgi:integrase